MYIECVRAIERGRTIECEWGDDAGFQTDGRRAGCLLLRYVGLAVGCGLAGKKTARSGLWCPLHGVERLARTDRDGRAARGGLAFIA